MQCIRAVLTIFAASTFLSSCTAMSDDDSGFSSSWKDRYGPSPNIKEVTADERAKAQRKIVQSFMDQSDTSYYHATLAGYNFIDEQCDGYIRSLFVLDKHREYTKEGITSAGTVTSGIMALSGASSATMAIVTQTFGLASSYTNTLYGGYLYGANAGSVYDVVSKLQKAYRDETAHQSQSIDNSATAYAYIRGYLRLCLPPTIEANIRTALTAAKAVSSSADNIKDKKDGTAAPLARLPGGSNENATAGASPPSVSLAVAK